MSKTTAERINSIANKYNVSYNVIKLFIYSDYGNKIIDENEKLNILEELWKHSIKDIIDFVIFIES